MHKTKLSQISLCLSQMKIGAEPVVFLHSNLFAFGLIENGVSGLYNLILEWLGPDGTLLMPSFSYHSQPNAPWKCNETPAKTGVFTEFFRKYPGVHRSIHPIHSVLAYGKHAEFFTKDIDPSSFGERSPFAKLYRCNAHNISLGTEFEGGATYLHYIEEMLQTPYRRYIEIPVEVYDQKNQLVNEEFVYYAREASKLFEYKNEWYHVWRDLSSAGVFVERKIGPAKVIHSRMRDAGTLLAEAIARNPFYCARKVDLKI